MNNRLSTAIRGYLSNPRLRRAGQVLSLTKEQAKEYFKCSENPIYFIENFVKIITIDEGLVQIKMWKFQKKLIKICHENNRVVVKAGRQTGKTTTLAVGYLLWYVLFQHDKVIGILAQKEKTAIEILGRIKNAYMNLPIWLQQGVREWNKESIELENNSKILSESTSSGAIRGFTLSLLYLDEFAFVPNNIAHEFLTSVYPTISSGKTSKIFVSSTPNGMNHFYKMVMEAKRSERLGVPGFKLVENTWRDRPDRDEAWAEDQKRTLGEDKFLQEMECEFLGSAGTLISLSALKRMVFLDAIKDLLDHTLKVYEDPQDKHQYILVADSSHGKELDYSAFTVVDVTTSPYKVVARYKCNTISAQEYPNIISAIGKHYNRAYVLAENNDIGSQVLQILTQDLEYENVFYTDTENNVTKLTIASTKTPGVRTTPKVKRQGCNALKTLIESQQLLAEDFDIISELSTFIIKKNKTYAAEDGCYDDLVMCLLLFSWLTTQDLFKDLVDQDMRKKLFDRNAQQIENEIPPQPMRIVAEPGPQKIRMDGIIWETVPKDTDNVDDRYTGYPDKSGFWIP